MSKFFEKAKPVHVVGLIVLIVTVFTLYSNIKYRGDINTTDEAKLKIELAKTEEIGTALTEAIIANRPYLSWDDLKLKVDGVGEQRISILKSNFKLTRKKE